MASSSVEIVKRSALYTFESLHCLRLETATSLKLCTVDYFSPNSEKLR